MFKLKTGFITNGKEPVRKAPTSLYRCPSFLVFLGLGLFL